MSYSDQVTCRVCGGDLKVVLALGDLHPSAFVEPGEALPEKAPLTLARCKTCDLVQLAHTVDLDSMYRTYYYQSGINASMVAALKDIVDEATKLVTLQDNSVVVDIACNDMTLLSFYPESCLRIGFDPALNLPRRAQNLVFINDYFNADRFPFEAPFNKAQIVTSIAMFYDLPDPPAFVKDVAKILHPEGVWIMQINDLKSMLELNAFDAICHEHLEYYSIADVINLVHAEGLQVFRIEHNDVNGGSLRFYIDFIGARPIEESVEHFLIEDIDYLNSPEGSIEAFAQRVQRARATILRWLTLEAAAGRRVYGLAASTKGNTLLQYFGIGTGLIQKIADKNPDKFGRVTVGTNIPIVPEEEALADYPSAMLVLAWGFLPFFLESMKEYLRQGGALIAPLPVPRSFTYDYNTGGVIETDLRWAIDQWEIEGVD